MDITSFLPGTKTANRIYGWLMISEYNKRCAESGTTPLYENHNLAGITVPP
ncbi:MAG: hypothetical protein SPD47_11075 [Oscillospiraceae bacterium]|nr:hypothetical protein [Oscillospiraceae bacterium]